MEKQTEDLFCNLEKLKNLLHNDYKDLEPIPGLERKQWIGLHTTARTTANPFGLYQKIKYHTQHYFKLQTSTGTTGRWLYHQLPVQLTVQESKHLKNQEKPMDGGG